MPIVPNPFTGDLQLIPDTIPKSRSVVITGRVAVAVSAFTCATVDEQSGMYKPVDPTATNSNDGAPIGLFLHAAMPMGVAQVMRMGDIIDDRAFMSFTPGDKLFCGLQGRLTNVVPTVAGTYRYATIVGKSISNNRIFFSAEQPIELAVE